MEGLHCGGSFTIYRFNMIMWKKVYITTLIYIAKQHKVVFNFGGFGIQLWVIFGRKQMVIQLMSYEKI